MVGCSSYSPLAGAGKYPVWASCRWRRSDRSVSSARASPGINCGGVIKSFLRGRPNLLNPRRVEVVKLPALREAELLQVLAGAEVHARFHNEELPGKFCQDQFRVVAGAPESVPQGAHQTGLSPGVDSADRPTGPLFSGGPPTTRESNKLVDQVLQELLPSARVGRDIAFLEHVGFEFCEAGFAGFDFGPDAAAPGTVSLLHKLG